MARVTTFHAHDGKSYLCLTAKRAYSIRQGERAEPLAEVPPIVSEAEYTASESAAAERLVADSDLFPGLKPVTDVIVRGTAYSHRGAATSFRASVRVGPVARTVQVWGDRTIELGRGGALTFSTPRPVASVPLVWDRAYGGRDEHAEEKLYAPRGAGALSPRDGRPARMGPLTYPRNPAGRGFFVDVDRERMAGRPAPNLEDPLDPVTPDRLAAPSYRAWIDCPAAGCFEPIDVFTFPRAVFFLPAAFERPKRELHEERIGVVSLEEIDRRMTGFDGRVDPRAFNGAAPGMAKVRLAGGERAELQNLHPRHPIFEFDLPGDVPELLLEPPGVRPCQLAPSLQTVLIEAERDRVTLTWAGLLEVAMPYPEERVESMRRAVVWDR
jgi:hypothetical protein